MSGPTEIPETTLGVGDRYGTDRPRRRGLALVIGALVVAPLGAWAVWAAVDAGATRLDASVTSYRIPNSHEIEVKVAVGTRDSGVDGNCLLRATAEDHTVVGELNVTADDLRSATGTWIPIRTERRATTADVVRCTR